jgi:hypothetical protein
MQSRASSTNTPAGNPPRGVVATTIPTAASSETTTATTIEAASREPAKRQIPW